jgi:hypothetical protein
LFTGLEQVNQLDNVLVLAHFQHFDLPPLLKNFDWLHVRLVDRLDRHLVAELLVLGQLDHAELTFAEVVLQIVEVSNVELANDLPDCFQPLRLVLDTAEVEDSRLIRRQYDLNRVEIAASVRVDFRLRLLDEGSSQAVHHPLVIIALIAEAHQIFADNLRKMLFEPISACFQETFAFEFELLLKLELVLTEIIHDHVLNDQVVALIQHYEGRARLLNLLIVSLEVALSGPDRWRLGCAGALRNCVLIRVDFRQVVAALK